MPLSPAALAAALAPYGVAPDPALLARLARYLELIAQGQQRVRLVGEATPEILAPRHLGESLYLAQLFDLAAARRLVDLGSGAGFPGLALALAWPQLKTTLVESTQKKAAFLRHAVAALGLEAQVEVEARYLERQPPAGARSPLAGADLVTVRALDKMAEVPTWLWRWLDPHTTAAFWLTAPTALLWRQDSSRWQWQPFSPLPAATTRGLQLARVSRGTPTLEPSLTPHP